MPDIHEIAIKVGAELAPAYEFNGRIEAATYTVTLAQLENMAAKITRRLLSALDGMDRGCLEPGFRGHENGYGENAGDELQAAREELAALVRYVPAAADVSNLCDGQRLSE